MVKYTRKEAPRAQLHKAATYPHVTTGKKRSMSSRKRTDHTETVKKAIQETGSGTPAQIAEETGLSVNQVGRALAQMETTGEATPAHESATRATVWDVND